MRAIALAGQTRALRHAEAVLLIGDDQPQRGKFYIRCNQRVRAHHDLRRAVCETRLDLTLLRRRHRPSQQRKRHAQRREQRRECFIVLLGENFRWRHERGLHAAARREKCRSRRDGGLAAAHVALHQPVHRRAGGEVVRDLPQHLLLCRRQAVGERGVKFRQCVGRDHDRALHAPLRPHEL